MTHHRCSLPLLFSTLLQRTAVCVCVRAFQDVAAATAPPDSMLTYLQASLACVVTAPPVIRDPSAIGGKDGQELFAQVGFLLWNHGA